MRIFLLLILFFVNVPLMAQELKPFTASYTADWKQLPVSGSAERSLEKKGHNRWALNFKASMIVASLTETSMFSFENNAFVPLTYKYKRGGLGKTKEIKLTFDWAGKKVTEKYKGKSIKIPLEAGFLDKSTYQIALQHDVAVGKKSMSYQVVNGDDIDTYDFRVLKEEQVETAIGSLDAIKVERVRDPTKSKRKTTLWFAKNWNYLLVALDQIEKDGKEYQIMLKEGSVDGKTVQADK